MSNVAQPDDVQELPKLQGHTIGFVDTRGEAVIFSPPTWRRWFNGCCATSISREF